VRSLLRRIFSQSISNEYKKAVVDFKIAEANNYPVSGNRDSRITRQSVAEIIVGTQGKNYSGKDAVRYVLGNNLAQGKGATSSVSGFAADDTLTRAEAVQFIRSVLNKSQTKTLLVRPVTKSPKNELPELPLPEIMVIGKSDKEIEILANKINPIAAESGYCTFYNGDTGAVGVTFCVDGGIAKGIMTYNEVNDSESYLMTRIYLPNMLIYNYKNDGDMFVTINEERLQIAISALKAIGFNLDDVDIKKIKTFYLESTVYSPEDTVNSTLNTVINGHHTELVRVSTDAVLLNVGK
jgi:hypothetical protein